MDILLRVRSHGVVFAVAVLLCVSIYSRGQVVADPAVLRIQVLNGKTGRPLVNQKIVLMGHDGVPAHSAHALASEMTDGEGYAALPDGASLAMMQVFVERHQPCSKSGAHEFALAKVRTAGVVSENSCRTRITMFPQAGTLIFFVRDETFIERMRH